MNSTEEQTAATLRSLAQRAAPATALPPDLAQRLLAQRAQAPNRRVKRGLSALGLLTVVGLVAAASLHGTSNYREWTQPSEAMSPTVSVNQTVLVGKNITAQRGDVVLIKTTNGASTFESLSRVIGLPGDTVSCPAKPDGSCEAVIVSGHALNEPWLTSTTAPFEQVTVPDGRVFLLGDARNLAADSRTIGPQRLDAVLGVVVARFNTNGHRQVLPGTPVHDLPSGGEPFDPANPVPPALSR